MAETERIVREAMQSLSSQRIALDSDDFIDDAIHADKRQQSAAAGEAVLLLLVGCGQASSCLLHAVVCLAAGCAAPVSVVCGGSVLQ